MNRLVHQRPLSVNPATPMSDQDGISPYNINTTSRIDRIKKNVN